MLLKFSKYQGAGNDFIIVNNEVKLTDDQIKFLCDRHFGVGSDGLMFVGYNNEKLEVRFNNPDASMSFCGNGSRCAMAYAVHELGANPMDMVFEGFDGDHKARFSNNYAQIEMHVEGSVIAVDDFYFVNTGAPHAVYKVDDVNILDINEAAKEARFHEKFQPIGSNVNFYSENADGSLSIRTFEKGVENETLACGTGITACALVHEKDNNKKPFHQTIHAKGGTAEVIYKEGILWLGGPAKKVFDGQLKLEEK
tara:strand:- start:30945 stop:31703 length:759 start_codon:yes stop_codon:yes gene_type:complete